MISRRKFIAIYVLLLLIVSVGLIGLGSWLIVPSSSTQSSHKIVEDTTPGFVSETYFTGAMQVPLINDVGKQVYGNDYARDDGGQTGYSIEWVAGKYADGTDIPESLADKFKGVVAGTHYYKITDNETGQIISNYHALTIQKDEFLPTATVSKPGPAFEGSTVTWTITLTGKYSGAKREFTHTLASVATDSYVYNSSTGAIACAKSMSENVLGNTLTTDGSYNNYSIPGITSTNYIGVNSNNFDNSTAAISYSVAYEILPTCYNSVDETIIAYYGNLTRAIESTTSGTLYALQCITYNGTTYKATAGTEGSFSHVITRSCTVAGGVTLTLPYGETVDTDVKETLVTGKLPSAFNSTTYNKNCVTVLGGVTLTNNGTINIAGIVSGGSGGYSQNSVTAKDHSRIVLAGSKTQPSKLINTGLINCYGYIAESTLNNGSELLMNGGTLTTVFTINEHRGGSVYVGLANPSSGDLVSCIISGSTYSPTMTTFPFNRFYIESVTAKMTVKSSAQVKGFATLYSDNQFNATTMDLIGRRSNNLIQLAAGTELVNKFDPTTQTHDIDIYGDATMNNLALLLTIVKSGQTLKIEMSSAGSYFPISYHWNINLKPYRNGNAAVVDTTNQYLKILPGGTLTVDEGVSVNASNMVVYSDNTLLNSTGYVAAGGYDNNTPGRLELNGSLTVANFGGYITSSVEDAVLNITGSASVTSYELVDSYDAELPIKIIVEVARVPYKASVYSTEAESTHAAVGLRDSNPSTPTAFTGGNAYYTDLQSGVYVWCVGSLGSVNLNANGGAFGSSTTMQQNAYFVPGSYLVTSLDMLTKPTKADYKFDGWYLDAACTTRATNEQVTTGATLYASWRYSPEITISIKDLYNTANQYGSATIFVDDEYTLLEETTYCVNYTKDRYLTAWTLVITGSDGTNIRIEYAPGDKICIFDILGLEDGYESDAQRAATVKGYTYSLVPTHGIKNAVSFNISKNNKCNLTAVVTLNGENIKSYSGATTEIVYVRPTDTLVVAATVSGTGFNVVIYKRYNNPYLKFGTFEGSGDGNNSTNDSISHSEVIGLEEDGTTTVTITASGS